jgi:hypothetical protein
MALNESFAGLQSSMQLHDFFSLSTKLNVDLVLRYGMQTQRAMIARFPHPETPKHCQALSIN